MKTTKNLGLNMPDEDDFVEIDKINENAEKIDEELAKKADASGGDISETVIAATKESKDEYPVPAAGDSAKTAFGKIIKFFADIRNWMTGVCLLGQIVNNCVTDNAKLPLSAAMGKQLQDAITVLNTNQLRTFISGYNRSSYIHIIPNIDDRTSIELHPDNVGECVWFVAGAYPRTAESTQVFTVNRDGYYDTIYGIAPQIAKYPSGSTFIEGYVRVTFASNYDHVIVIGTVPSVITAV